MGIDYTLFTAINQYAGQNAILDSIGIFIAEYLILIFILFLIVKFKNSLLLIGSAISSFIAYALNHLISLFYFRPRPFISHKVNLLVQHVADKSFPSDHATLSFALATSIFLYNRKYGIPALIIASLISISRVFCGLHYVSDIIVGAAMGIVVSFITFKSIEYSSKKYKIRWFQQKKPRK